MRWVIVAVMLLMGQPVSGQGLISVPTGDVLPKGTLSVDGELDTGRRLCSPETLVLTTWRFGLTHWLTVGADVRLNRRVIVTPNFSLRLWRSSRWSIAYGVENVGVRSFGEQPYLTVSHRAGRVRWHLGWTNDERDRAMGGIEWQLTQRCTLQSDFIAGRGNFFAIGLQWSLSENLALTVAFLRPNARDDEQGVFVDLNWTHAVGR